MSQTVAYNMDCMEAMRTFPDKFFDLAVVDPPYGIGITAAHKVGNHAQIVGGGGRAFGGNNESTLKKRTYISTFYRPFDDSAPPDEEYFRALFRVSKYCVIWGGNFFLEHLGKASCMIVWDKHRRGMDQADCEIAWTNLPGQSRIFEYTWNGMLQGDMKNKEDRFHPTQKPVALYAWIFAKYAKPGYKILDTHLGSGSSRIAAYDAGLDFWGYEIDKEYFDKQEERFAIHTSQVSMFE
jgi:site-specific DNA-methyltransferase (adenine-specific)